jgi:hypothetical protein
MNLDAGTLLASLCVSGVGYVLFMYGKKQGRFPQSVTGLALLVFPYFVGRVGPMLLIGAVLLAFLLAAVRLGWWAAPPPLAWSGCGPVDTTHRLLHHTRVPG